MTYNRAVAIFCVFAQIVVTVIAAGALEIDNESVDASSYDFVHANISSDLNELFVVAQNDGSGNEYNPDEAFYFGDDEEIVRAELEKQKNAKDAIARAHRDIELYLGAGFAIMATTLIVMGATNTTREYPEDYITGRKKYDEVFGEDKPILLHEEKNPYYPSIVCGAGLGLYGLTLFLK